MSDRCTETGAVRLNGPIPSEGRVEICSQGHDWVSVCYDDDWDDNDAAVVCRELRHTADGKSTLAFHSQISSVSIIRVLLLIGARASYVWIRRSTGIHTNFDCSLTEERLRDCTRSDHDQFACRNNRVATVRCREDGLRVKNVNVAINTPHYTIHCVLVTWELHNVIAHQPSSFLVQCFNELYYLKFSVNNETFISFSVNSSLPSLSYICCVSAIYYGYYTAERRCYNTLSETLISGSFTSPSSTEMLQSDSFTSPASNELDKFVSSDLNNMRASIIGGVLGSIIVILLLLLAMCGGALLYLLQSRGVIPKR